MLSRSTAAHLVVAAGAIYGVSTATGQDAFLEPIRIGGNQKTETEAGVIERNNIEEGPGFDTAEHLDEIPGVSVIRKGGQGGDIVIRGQKANRLNVKLGERFVHGGCPNRMDPPTAYATPEFYDIVEIQKGVHTLSEGRGGPGGTVLFKSSKPKLLTNSYEGKVGGGYQENGDVSNAYGTLAFGDKNLNARLSHVSKQAGDYQDGYGNEINSSFNQNSSSGAVFWNASSSIEAKIKYERDRLEDVEFQGLAMDSPESYNDSYEANFRKHFSESFFESLALTAYSSRVEHLMSNRDRQPIMLMEVDSSSNTTGAKLEAEFKTEFSKGRAGIDMQNLEQTAQKTHNGSLNTYMWPDARINQIGVFAEAESLISAGSTLKYGLRADFINAKAKKAELDPPGMPPSPATAYKQVYGVDYGSRNEVNLGALLRYTRQFNARLGLFAAVSRIVRTADTNERFIHKEAMAAAQKETGNPNIEPEKHHQADFGVTFNNGHIKGEASIFYDNVSDFITLDRARGQDGVLISDGRAVYRNVEARLAGAELTGELRLDSGFFVLGALNYTYGENKTDQRPLYEIPPVELRLDIGKQKDNWSASASLNANLSQTRTDSDTETGSGVDARDATPGWVTVDLKASRQLAKNLKINGGVSNLFNKGYAKHLNLRDVVTASQVQVNEPGRSIWANAVYSF